MDIVAPTAEQMLDEIGVKCVQNTSDTSWRHGSRETTVYHRADDDTYWRATYRVSTDGETHELRDGGAVIARVYPHKVEAVEYRTAP